MSFEITLSWPVLIVVAILAIWAEVIHPVVMARQWNAKQIRNRVQSKMRSEKLLMEHLTDRQRYQWSRSREFTVRGGVTGQKYHVRETGVCDDSYRYCLITSGIPVADLVLVRKVLIESDEDRFLKVAIRSVLRPERG